MKKDRRTGRRVGRRIDFNCYINGHRFDSASLDVSRGGALLSTPDPIDIGARLMIVPNGEESGVLPIMLVGHVVRNAGGGLGVAWEKCLSRGGVKAVFACMKKYPELFSDFPMTRDPRMNKIRDVAYDFEGNRLFPVKLAGIGNFEDLIQQGADDGPKRRPEVQCGATAGASVPRTPGAKLMAERAAKTVLPSSRPQQGSGVPLVSPYGPAGPPTGTQPAPADVSRTLVDPPAYSRKPMPGAVTQLLTTNLDEMETSIPASLASLQGGRHDCLVRMLGLHTAFVTTYASAEEVGEKVRITLPVPLHRGTVDVELACSLIACGKHPTVGQKGMHFEIKAAYQPGKPGLFERYVKYLYYQKVSG